MKNKTKSKEKYIEKYYLVEYYGGEMIFKDLKGAIKGWLGFRKSPSSINYAISKGDARIYSITRITTIKRSKCLKKIKEMKR